MSVLLTGNDLTFAQLYAVALGGEDTGLAPASFEKMNASRAAVERLLASGATAYGINTGFGKLASVRISPDEVRQLQVNLVRSHASGVGPSLGEAESRHPPRRGGDAGSGRTRSGLARCGADRPGPGGLRRGEARPRSGRRQTGRPSVRRPSRRPGSSSRDPGGVTGVTAGYFGRKMRPAAQSAGI